MMADVLRVVEWDRRYETRASLKKSGPLDAVPVLTDLGQGQIQRLLDLPGGLHAFGIWNILWMLAARCSRRGVLADRGIPLTPHELAKAARCSVPEIEQAVKLLRSPGVELLERVPLEQALQPAEIPPTPPRKPRKLYSLPFTHCPNCHTDLVAAAEQVCGCAGQHDEQHHVQPAQAPHPHVAHAKRIGSPDIAKEAGVTVSLPKSMGVNATREARLASVQAVPVANNGSPVAAICQNADFAASSTLPFPSHGAAGLT